MKIRLSKLTELPVIMQIYDKGRQTMRQNGNDKQWTKGFPQQTVIEEDIKNGVSHVVVDDDDIPHAVFSFILGEDPTYLYIEKGSWLNSKPYGTIHRIASDGYFHGIVQLATDFGFTKTDNIRIDTHELNTIMQHTVQKCGYQRCGIIYIADGTPRIAFQICR